MYNGQSAAKPRREESSTTKSVATHKYIQVSGNGKLREERMKIQSQHLQKYKAAKSGYRLTTYIEESMEVDAYTFAKIYKSAATVGLGNVISGTVNGKPLEALNAGFTYLDNVEVPAENQMIFMSPNYLNLLRNTTEVTKFLSQGDYDKNVSFKMTEYEGRKLVIVPPQRFNTEVVLEKNGYRVAGTPIDFMIVPKDAVTHIVKYNKVKVLEKKNNSIYNI